MQRLLNERRRQLGEKTQCGSHLLNETVLGETSYLFIVKLTGSVHGLKPGVQVSVTRSCRSVLVCDPTRDLTDNSANFSLGVGMLGHQLDAHVVTCLLEKRREDVPGDVGATSGADRKPIVTLRALNNSREARFRELCTRILHRAYNDLCVATLDQHVRDRRAQRVASRNCKEMFLALLFGILDQGRIIESFGLGEDRTGDINVIIEREGSNDLRRSRWDGRQTYCQQGARRNFDINDKADEDIIKERDVFI